MALEVLQADRENKIARAEMRRKGIDFTSGLWIRLARKLHLMTGINVGEYLKSWDVLKTVQFIERAASYEAPILDIGAFASEMLCALHRIGYKNLHGIDLNPKLHSMPFSDEIRYITGDFMHMPYKDDSFSAVTAISVIEHGFNPQKLLQELARVVKPGGYFIASVDYWPEKIDTENIKVFGTDWRIFSEQELLDFIERAKQFGFRPVGELHAKASAPIVQWQGKRYTFAWFAVQKM
jgi:SAM-dependent methyltransferase